MALALELVFQGSSYEPSAGWEAVVPMLREAGLLEGIYKVVAAGAPVTVERVSSVLRKKRSTFFAVEGNVTTCSNALGKGGAWCLDIEFHEESRIPATDLMNNWIAPMGSIGRLHYARLYDTVWEQWQNERQVAKFGYVGRSIEGLKLVWDSTFEEEVVDTTVNPGRIVERDGYMEAVGHQMWLPEEFWKLTGANRGALEAAFPSRTMDDLLAVSLSPKPFGDTNLPSEKLRRLLFP